MAAAEVRRHEVVAAELKPLTAADRPEMVEQMTGALCQFAVGCTVKEDVVHRMVAEAYAKICPKEAELIEEETCSCKKRKRPSVAEMFGGEVDKT